MLFKLARLSFTHLHQSALPVKIKNTQIPHLALRGKLSDVNHPVNAIHVFLDPRTCTTSGDIALELRNRDRERKLIKKIDESIALIENGEYGYCESCGVEIGLKRLEARPTATMCIDCKELEERREKQMAK